MIDANVTLSRWPTRRVNGDEPAELVGLLREHGVEQAWTSSFEALLHKDIAAVNARLAADCERYGDGLLIPFGAINPSLPDWEDDLRRCHEEHRMPGVRLFPGYHGYPAGEAPLERLLRMAAERGLIVQIAVRLQDPRTQPPQWSIAPVQLDSIAATISRVPKLRLVLLNAFGSPGIDAFRTPPPDGHVAMDIATLEGIGGVAQMIERLGLDRLVFGSNAPLFHIKSAVLKMHESALTERQSLAILEANARRILRHGR